MADKKGSGRSRISRREIVGLLGSGIVARVVLSTGEVQLSAADCNSPADVAVYKANVPTGKPPQKVLFCRTCCKVTKSVIDAGAGSLSSSGQKHIGPVKTQVAANEQFLLEYVFMMWGLSESEVRRLQNAAVENLKLAELKEGK